MARRLVALANNAKTRSKNGGESNIHTATVAYSPVQMVRSLLPSALCMLRRARDASMAGRAIRGSAGRCVGRTSRGSVALLPGVRSRQLQQCPWQR